jgi:hypothetical protein
MDAGTLAELLLLLLLLLLLINRVVYKTRVLIGDRQSKRRTSDNRGADGPRITEAAADPIP